MEEHRKLARWRSLKFHSIFIRTLCVVSTLSLCLLFLFYQYVGQFYQRNYQNAVVDAASSAMRMSSNLLQLQVVSLQTQISELFQSGENGHLLLMTEISQEAAAADFALDLYYLAQRNEGIEELWCRLLLSGQTYTSDKKVLVEDSQYTELLDWCEQEGYLNGSPNSGQILPWKGALYWVQGYPAEKPLAVAFVRFNQEKLLGGSELLERQDGKVILPYWNGEALCLDLLKYPPQETLKVLGREARADDLELCQAADGENFFLVLDTELPGLDLMMCLAQEDLNFSIWEFLGQFWSYALIALVLLIAAVYLLAQCTYFPMRRLLRDLVSREDGEILPANISSELGLIQALYDQKREHAEHLDSLVRQAGTAVEQKILSRLAHGETEDGAQVRETLFCVNSFFVEAELFSAVLIGWRFISPTRETDKALYQLRLRQDIQRYWDRLTGTCMVPWGENQDMLLLAFPVGKKELEISRQISIFLKQLQKDCQPDQIEMTVGDSRCYSKLEELSAACRDAEQKFLERIGRTWSVEIGPPLETEVCAWLEDGVARWGVSPKDKTQIFSPVLQGLRTKDGRYYGKLADLILNAVPDGEIETGEDWQALRGRLAVQCETNVDRNACEQIIWNMLELATESLLSVGRRNQRQYLALAKQIIRQQYKDSGLSLQLVSAQCGISSFYLSRLFSQWGDGGGFTDYLNQYRIAKAKPLLEKNELTISEVGEQVGFNSAQSFIRVFKKYEGETPGQYRTRCG